MNIKRDNILKTYRGKRGCMCGCLGNYRVPTHMVEAASKDRGYPYGEEDISDRAVNMLWNKFLKESQADPDSWKLDLQSNCVYQITETRQNVIYFKG